MKQIPLWSSLPYGSNVNGLKEFPLLWAITRFLQRFSLEYFLKRSPLSFLCSRFMLIRNCLLPSWRFSLVLVHPAAEHCVYYYNHNSNCLSIISFIPVASSYDSLIFQHFFCLSCCYDLKWFRTFLDFSLTIECWCYSISTILLFDPSKFIA